MEYIKKENPIEIISLKILEELKIIKKVYPDYMVKDNIIYVKMCNQENFKESFFRCIDLCHNYLYSHHFDCLTDGIYSYIGIKENIESENFADRMRLFLEHISKGRYYDKELLSSVIKNISDYYSEIKNSRLCLLHGDLHMGNVVVDDGEVKLIDFEYMRVGIPELELSYFMILSSFALDDNIIVEFLNMAKEKIFIMGYNMNLINLIFMPVVIISVRYYKETNYILNKSITKNKIKIIEDFIKKNFI